MAEIPNEQLERLTHNTHSVDVPSRIIRKVAAELLQARWLRQELSDAGVMAGLCDEGEQLLPHHLKTV